VKATLIELDLDQVDSSGNLMGVGRSPGVHLGQVIKFAKAKAQGPENETGNQLFMSIGFLLEVMIEQAWKTLGAWMRIDRTQISRPREQLLDGIYMSPDGIDVHNTLEEYKATYTSMGRLIGTNPKKDDCAGDVTLWLRRFHWWWLVQIMGYAKALGTLRARLIVLMVNGDYTFKQPFGGPQILAIDLEFTQEDLDANWENVLRWRDEMLAEEVA
jgi:hypothetical protein